MSSKFKNELNTRLRGTHRFLFAKSATEANQYAIPYRDLGNIPREGITYNPSSDKFEEESMIGGEAIVESIDYIKQMSIIDVRIDEIGLDNLKLILRAEDAAAVSQSALSNQDLDVLDFSSDSVIIDQWYPLTNGGSPVYKPTAIAAVNDDSTPVDLVEGVDYEYTPDLLMVRFLRADLVDGFSITFTVTTSLFSATPIEIQKAAGAISGMGMLRTYVKGHSQKESALLWTPFGCLIDYEEAMNIVVESNVKATLRMTVTSPRPTIIDFRQ